VAASGIDKAVMFSAYAACPLCERSVGIVSLFLYSPVVFAVFTKTEQDYVWYALWKKMIGNIFSLQYRSSKIPAEAGQHCAG
jgi:hypothetical protein